MSPKLDRWSDFVALRPRYSRSVHLERDAQTQKALDGYVLTPLVRTLTRRILDGFDAASPARAWSVTGPYGTGKSAFALFLADAFAPPELHTAKIARKLLTKADPNLALAAFGARGVLPNGRELWPVLATGERRSLQQVLLRALLQSVELFWSGPGSKPSIVSEVTRAAKRAAAGQTVAARDIVALFETTAEKIAASNLAGTGLLVVLDEAGKVLEHAAHHSDEGDVQLLQELAEAANRSGDSPLVFVVMLHQAFEQYAGRLSLTERGEWAKVQGRFEDLAFQEASHELLLLVGEALARGSMPKGMGAALERVVNSSMACIGSIDAVRLRPLLSAALPLHPVTAMLLGPLFRSRVAQNERSLFAFLGSSEPRGFQEFLTLGVDEGGEPNLFLPDALYDYVAVSLGGRLDGHMGREWAQIETALRRLPPGATDLDAKVIKTIGILGLFGDAAGISASDSILKLLYGSEAGAMRELSQSLDRLAKASLLVFRKFRNAYQLWEGSDLDIDALVREALSQVDSSGSLVQRLTRVAPPRPLVARRHLFETGTFRYFELRYVDASAFDEGIPTVDANADGAILMVVEPTESVRTKFLHRIMQPMPWMAVSSLDSKPVLVAVPRHVGRLLEVGAELAALEWVQTHTPELQDDLVARREVAKRIAEAERQLRGELSRLLGGDVACDWVHNGASVDVGSFRNLARVVSELCDQAYAQAPHIHNELLNRRQLSSAAAAARRTLLEAMATKAAEERLGFEGSPPEVSMYRSLLERHGLHRKRDGQWGLGGPTGKGVGSLKPAWDALDRALAEGQELRLSLPTLFEKLRRPPFGMKEGVLPVLLVTTMLSWKDEVALYEDGAFVPSLTGASLERMLKQPERFQLQRLSIAGPRAALYARLLQTLTGGSKATPGLVPIVRQLVRVVSDLPDFSRMTKSISPKAQAVREALLRAKEPGPLVFRDLPVACGLQPFEAKGVLSDALVERYIDELRGAMRELQLAYTRLLDTIEESVRIALSLPSNSTELRREIAARGSRILPVTVEAQLKAFLIRSSDDDMPREEWLVSLGTLLAGKPPESWHDRDVEQMRLALGIVSRRFASLESMTLANEGSIDPNLPPMLRLVVTQPGQPEQERTVPMRTADDGLVEAVCSQLRAITSSAAASLPREAILAALGLVARDMMAELNEGENQMGRELTT